MRALALVALAGCATFEDPTIVLDLRVIGIETTPPEQVIVIEDGKTPTIDDVLVQLRRITVRAVIAEPGRNADLPWTMTACVLDEDSRCDPEHLMLEFANGVLPDPETSSFGSACPNRFDEPGGVLCGELVPDNRLVQMLFAVLAGDPAGGLGGIDIGLVLRVGGVDDVYAVKHVRFVPNVPEERAANNNPHIDQLLIGLDGTGVDTRKAHCADPDPPTPNRVPRGEAITLFPVSRMGDREEYVLPTLDGQSERFTEYLTYQWLATAGDFSDDETGGPPDIFGNIRLDGTEWTAPDGTGTVTIWVLQRDARYGTRWREACIQVF